MTSEAGSRPLSVRMAPSGSLRERATTSDTEPKDRAAKGPTTPAGGSAGAHGSGTRKHQRRTNGRDHDAHPKTTLIKDDPLAALLDEAQAAVAEGANTLRDVRERYRTAYVERLGQWETLRAGPVNGPRTGHDTSDETMLGREVG